MRQALVRDYYSAKILYYFFELLSVLKWKNLRVFSMYAIRKVASSTEAIKKLGRSLVPPS
jgi:hypothetical protein